MELEKYKCAWRKSNVELETTRKNAEKRSQLAESAEKCANERIEEIKREQWSIIEKIKSEKRETDVLLQKEIDEKSKTCSEFELFRQNSQAEKSDWERVKGGYEFYCRNSFDYNERVCRDQIKCNI